MILKSALQKIINEQKRVFFHKKSIKRELQIPEISKRIVIISGVRRCGKSTLIKKHFLHKDNTIYINFEDPRLVDFELQDFNRLEDLLENKYNGHLLLDEIQNINQWEIYARSAHERGISLIITGSNASLLSRELGTKLTGRYSQFELFPFNFSEFLVYFNLKRNKTSFEKYFELGGFPEYLEENIPDYHRILLRDIITRDIAVRRNLQNENILMRLAVHLLSNIGKDISYNKLSKTLEIKSVRTVIDYCDYLSESYIMDFVPVFSYSAKKQMVNPKKVYTIDIQFARANSLSFSKDMGRGLENIVYLKLRSIYKELFYFRNNVGECDFVVKERNEVILAIQVCWQIDNDNMKRELIGLEQAINTTGAKKGIIITFNQEDELNGIKLIPVWKWI